MGSDFAPESPVGLSRALLAAARDGAAAADALAGGLPAVDPAAIAGDPARKAFWLNIYNARLLHSLAHRPRSGRLFRHRRMFRTESYDVGGLAYSLDAIEHGLLRGNARPPYSPRRVLRGGDPRLAAAPSAADPRIHFALNCGARSCPPIRSYSAEGLDDELDGASTSYIAAESRLDREGGELELPGLVKLYRGDFGPDRELVEMAAASFNGADASWIRERGEAIRIRFAPFDWRIESQSE
jgi:Protein of unknown function, DUF547